MVENKEPEIPKPEVAAPEGAVTPVIETLRTLVHFSDTADTVLTHTVVSDSDILEYIQTTPDVQEFLLFQGTPQRLVVQRKSVVTIDGATLTVG